MKAPRGPAKEQHYKDQVKALTDALQAARVETEYWKNLFLGIRQRAYGKATEAAGQLGLDLFDEAEAENLAMVLDQAQGPVQECQVAGYTKRIAKGGLMELDASTPVVDITHEAPAPECACGSTMVKAGELVTSRIASIPACKVIVRHHYPQFSCPACLPDPGEAVKTTIADGGDVLAGTICEPALLATVVTDKMQSGLPLYRQEQRIPAGEGRISRQAMSAWMMLAGKALEPLGKALERQLLTYAQWNVDETGVRVLRVPGPDPEAKPPGSGGDAESATKERAMNCYMAVRAATAADGSRGPVVFTFLEHRTNDSIQTLLKDYRGVCQTDGLAQYGHARENGSFTHLGCMVHARRKAADIVKKFEKHANNAKKPESLVLPRDLLKLYRTFFHHERLLLDARRAGGDLADDGCYLARRREVLGADLDEIKAWLNRYHAATLKGMELHTAITYALDRWEELTAFLDYPFAISHNNLAENSIRPFVLARKGFLFCITPQGAKVSALFYSLVESCKAMGINAHAYLCHLFFHAGSCRTDADWDALLPGKADLSGIDGYYALLQSAKPDPLRTEPYVIRGKRSVR